MLKTKYATLEEIAEPLRAYYTPKNGAYVLALEGDANDVFPGIVANRDALRSEKQALENVIGELQKQVPKDGSVVLSKSQAEAYEEYKSLGKIEALKTIITERDTLKTEAATLKADSELRTAADAAGWNFDTLKSLVDLSKVRGEEVAFAITEIDVEGKKQKVVNATVTKDGKAETKAATDWVKGSHPTLEAALVVESQAQQQGVPHPATPPNRGRVGQPVDKSREKLQETGRYALL